MRSQGMGTGHQQRASVYQLLESSVDFASVFLFRPRLLFGQSFGVLEALMNDPLQLAIDASEFIVCPLFHRLE